MTPDDWRNFGWKITEALRVKPEWSRYLFDLRVGFKRGGKWKPLYVAFWKPVSQNFWNGVFTWNIYILKCHLWRLPLLIPRVNLVVRYRHDHWFQAGIGYLFDRGEFGAKLVFSDWKTEERFNPGCNAWGWDEGSV